MTRNFIIPTQEKFPLPSYRDWQPVTPDDTFGLDEVDLGPYTTTGKVRVAVGNRNPAAGWSTAGGGVLSDSATKDPSAASDALLSSDVLNAEGLRRVNNAIAFLYPPIANSPFSGKEKVVIAPDDIGSDGNTNWFAFKPSDDLKVYEAYIILFNPTNNLPLTNSDLSGHAAVYRYVSTLFNGSIAYPGVRATGDNNVSRFRASTSRFNLGTGWLWMARNASPFPQYLAGASTKAAVCVRSFTGATDKTGPVPREARVASALHVGGAGDLALQTLAGETQIIKGVTAGSIIPVYTDKVFKTNTTATNITALYEEFERSDV